MTREAAVRLPSRRERAVATRQRMVEAAYRLMSTRGYLQTTVADIAGEAGVAVQTVYFTFHNKPALLRAAFQYAVHGDHLPMSPAERPWFAAMQKESDHERALGMFVDASIEILRRVLPLSTTGGVNAAPTSDDPEIASFQAFSERLRRDGYRRVVEALAATKPLRPGLDAEDATSILLVLVGTDVYRSMLSDSGWPEAKWRSWVIQTLSEALFGL
jgi:AcrR family transcriptional regulator